MKTDTAKEMASEYLEQDGVARDHDQFRRDHRVVTQSLVSLLPETDDWAVVPVLKAPAPGEETADDGIRILAKDQSRLWRVEEQATDAAPLVTADLIDLAPDCRVTICDTENYETSGAYRFTRIWYFTFPRNLDLIFVSQWLLHVEGREPSRGERLGLAIAAESGWSIGDVPDLSIEL